MHQDDDYRGHADTSNADVEENARMGNDASANRELVRRALTEAFIDKDASAIDRYWAGPAYIQHHAQMPNGTDMLKGFVGMIGPTVSYEIGKIVAEGDIVMVHSRHNLLTPEMMIAVNIFRVQDGRLVEHWEVMQPEVGQTVSGNPMFTPA
jgi:predicted SnoaL-like aldol condensation-catalyzing enzyme